MTKKTESTSESEKCIHSCTKRKGFYFLISLALIALAIYCLGSAIGDGLKEFRTGDRYVTVKGLSERTVPSDSATLSVTFSSNGPSIQQAYEGVVLTSEKVKAFLLECGINESEIGFSVSSKDRLSHTNDKPIPPDERYLVSGTYFVKTNQVMNIVSAESGSSYLISQGVNVSNFYTNYYYNNINKIKPEMISEAIKAARESAEQFAIDSDSKVGKIRTANQGSIRITDQGSEYGSSNSVYKTVRVVSTIVYNLKD